LLSSATQTGLPPFYDENVNTMYQRILTDPLNFPLDMPSEARSVMTGLLQRDPLKRLGAHGSEEIKKHPFFAKYIDWNRLVVLHLSAKRSLTDPSLGCSRRSTLRLSSPASYVLLFLLHRTFPLT
jgi:serine/threonine protein kinase